MAETMKHLADVMGGGSSKPAKKIHHIRHRRTANGGHVFEHHHTHPEHHPTEEHSYDTTDGAVSHFIDHATDENPGEGQPMESASSEPMAPMPEAGTAMPMAGA